MSVVSIYKNDFIQLLVKHDIDFEKALVIAVDMFDNFYSQRDYSTECKHGVFCRLSDCKFSHPIEKPEPCEYSNKCTDIFCPFTHPSTWKYSPLSPLSKNICFYLDRCVDYNCKRLHPGNRLKLCPLGNKCDIPHCLLIHPNHNKCVIDCCYGDRCMDYHCKYLHPGSRRSKCVEGNGCCNISCNKLHPFEHPLTKQHIPCCYGDKCIYYYCKFLHPYSRTKQCPNAHECSDPNCVKLHPPEYAENVTQSIPCTNGNKCKNYYK